MTPIATYVFLDLETTGLPSEELNKTRVTEISMIAVKRQHVLETMPGAAPRVQHKLTLCLNPGKYIQPGCEEVTGLNNFLLEHEPVFNLKVHDMINTFLDILEKPVCIIAQNGHRFDFPILKAHMDKLKVSLIQDLLCADSYYAFMDIEHARNEQITIHSIKTEDASKTLIDEVDQSNQAENGSTNPILVLKPEETVNLNTSSIQKENETTPKRQIKTLQPATPCKNVRVGSKVRKRFPWSEGSKPTVSYKLSNVYERLLNRPSLSAHRAESDCIMAMECCVSLSAEFVKWVDENSMLFSDVKSMTIGVPLGLLILTGALWGCTNPFIRRGTRGLRDVKAKSWAGQAYAEVRFLLGNWQYIVPWLVNQAGSLVYLRAIQHAPLSLAVPTANSLAFVFTAVTGAGVGMEEPLDKGSMLGIALIAAGTALCCWDKTD